MTCSLAEHGNCSGELQTVYPLEGAIERKYRQGAVMAPDASGEWVRVPSQQAGERFYTAYRSLDQIIASSPSVVVCEGHLKLVVAHEWECEFCCGEGKRMGTYDQMPTRCEHCHGSGRQSAPPKLDLLDLREKCGTCGGSGESGWFRPNAMPIPCSGCQDGYRYPIRDFVREWGLGEVAVS